MATPKTDRVLLPEDNLVEDTPARDDAEICGNCCNVFTIALLKIGDDYNDFGQRYCPYCGLLANGC
jgi:hypothetical protein